MKLNNGLKIVKSGKIDFVDDSMNYILIESVYTFHGIFVLEHDDARFKEFSSEMDFDKEIQDLKDSARKSFEDEEMSGLCAASCHKCGELFNYYGGPQLCVDCSGEIREAEQLCSALPLPLPEIVSAWKMLQEQEQSIK